MLYTDPGGEFTGQEFQTLLQNYHIRGVCTTTKNPQDMASTKEYINEALSIGTDAM
jgi:hypothetical protein